MEYTLQNIYEYFFPYRDDRIAEDFANSDEYDMAFVYLQNLQIEPEESDFKRILSIMKQIKEMVMCEYSFYEYSEDDTGHTELRTK